MRYLFLMFCLVTMPAFLSADAFSQSYAVNWYKISGGGGTSPGGTFSVCGTIGQADADTAMNGGSFSLRADFGVSLPFCKPPGRPTC